MRHTQIPVNVRLAWALSLIVLICSMHTKATTVQFQTVLGNFEVALFDEDTPLTVANFLTYLEEGFYKNSIVHRVESGFVLQGGGFRLSESDTLHPIPTFEPIKNEAVFSNVQGTIAMAKPSDGSNSVTNQWFVNLADNSQNLNFQNGGFTVFGRVIGSGMTVINAMASSNTLNFESFPDLPLLNYSEQDAINGELITEQNYIVIHDIIVVDESITSGSAERPMAIGQPSPSPTPVPNDDPGSTVEGVGSVEGLSLLTLLFIALLGRPRYQDTPGAS